MIYLAIVLQWLHVLFAIAWFGSSIFIVFVMTPTIRQLSATAQDEYLRAFELVSKRFFPITGGMTVLLGILRGLVLGIQPASPYGITFIAALVLGIALSFWGARVTGPSAELMARTPAGPEKLEAFNRTMRVGYIELGGFLIVLALMVAMRFGY